jgi:1-acyl-sn-glycerol-3-phosphate acyltransferase
MQEELGRRLVTIPALFAAWLTWIVLLPLVLPIAALVDGVRHRRGIVLRVAALVTAFLTCEVAGIAAATALWLWRYVSGMEETRWIDLHFRLEAWWGATLFRSVVRIFGLRIEVEGSSDLDRGPYLLLVRHSSSGDTLLASALVSARFGTRLRYVLKRGLLWDPCLDVVGNRLPNVFVDRGATDSRGEVERVRALAGELGPSDGLLIYPEGTRFSEGKRRRVIEHLSRTGEPKMLEYARSLDAVLPPRLGGTLALLEAAPDADIVFCSHTGFEPAASLRRVWSGELVHQTIRVRFERIARTEVPEKSDARVTWLLEEWRKVDAWVSRWRTS